MDHRKALVERAGWEADAAERHFDQFAPHYEIHDAVEFTVAEAGRLRQQYPALLVAPLPYTVDGDRLAQIRTSR